MHGSTKTKCNPVHMCDEVTAFQVNVFAVVRLCDLRILINPLNAAGANRHQVNMLTKNYGIERVDSQCSSEC